MLKELYKKYSRKHVIEYVLKKNWSRSADSEFSAKENKCGNRKFTKIQQQRIENLYNSSQKIKLN
jgi:hypothetical protein